MPPIYTNNASSRLLGNLEIGATTLNLVDGSGFPAPGVGEWFWVTLERAGGIREIVKVVARTGGTCTVERAQQGTTERAWPRASTVAEHRWTAADASDGGPGGALPVPTIAGQILFAATTAGFVPALPLVVETEGQLVVADGGRLVVQG